MKPSDIEPGFYYEKKTMAGWLRLVVGRRDGFMVYADFTGHGMCSRVGSRPMGQRPL
jgi:hypothetical protein